ncbi:MAG: DcrB-related protein, partial [Deltaproteobacteria bacterium]|nr:DcrB-related protein [Deltaproteobacteria bacterium]
DDGRGGLEPRPDRPGRDRDRSRGRSRPNDGARERPERGALRRPAGDGGRERRPGGPLAEGGKPEGGRTARGGFRGERADEPRLRGRAFRGERSGAHDAGRARPALGGAQLGPDEAGVALSRAGGLAGADVAGTVNPRGLSFLQSPSDGQIMVVPTDKAVPLDSAELDRRMVHAQMNGTPAKGALSDALGENGYAVYERPAGDYASLAESAAIAAYVLGPGPHVQEYAAARASGRARARGRLTSRVLECVNGYSEDSMPRYRDHQMSFDVPRDWEDRSLVAFSAPLGPGQKAAPNLVLTRDRLPEDLDLDGYADRQLDALEERLDELEILERERIEVGGQPAVRARFVSSGSAGPFEQWLTMIQLPERVVASLTMSVPEAEADRMAPLFEHILSSVRLAERKGKGER